MASRRLQKVVIENRDFEKLIRQYDSPVSFFYCDPPYYATENYYKDVGFTADDHIRFRDGQIEWTAPAILFGCLIFTLTAPLYIWSII